MSMYNIEESKKRPHIKNEREKKSAAAGFVLSIFRSASEDVTRTPRGEKEFGVEFN